MKTKVIFKDCASSNCPTVYETDQNTYLIQGYVIKDHHMELPDGENLIQIPKEFLDKFILSQAK